jgi:hypothetical protein
MGPDPEYLLGGQAKGRFIKLYTASTTFGPVEPNIGACEFVRIDGALPYRRMAFSYIEILIIDALEEALNLRIRKVLQYLTDKITSPSGSASVMMSSWQNLMRSLAYV